MLGVRMGSFAKVRKLGNTTAERYASRLLARAVL
jgi:hypothetical protein